jgi:hypothetical protein
MGGGMRGRAAAGFCGVLLAGGYLVGGAPAVLGLALVAVAVVAGYVYSPSWKAGDRPGGSGGRWFRGPRPPSRGSGAGGAPGVPGPARVPGAPEVSGVRIGHERDADVVHHEGGQGEGVEDLMEAEPPR